MAQPARLLTRFRLTPPQLIYTSAGLNIEATPSEMHGNRPDLAGRLSQRNSKHEYGVDRGKADVPTHGGPSLYTKTGELYATKMTRELFSNPLAVFVID
jgi:hypothetical protein